MLGSSPKGKSGARFPTYHCGGKKRGHNYYGVSKDKFEDEVKGFVSAIEPSRELLNSFEKVLKDVYRKRQKEVLSTSVRIDNNVADLKSEKERIVEKLISTNSEITTKILEDKIEKLDKEIKEVKMHRDKLELTENDIEAFIRHANYLIEHFEELLLDNTNIQRQRALFSLVFEETPSYQDVLDRTPKLSLIFQQKRTSQKEKSHSVIRLGIEPRTVSLKGCCSTS